MQNEEKRKRLLYARICLKEEYRKKFSYRGMHFALSRNRLYSDDFSMYLEIDLVNAVSLFTTEKEK